ncbi:ImmA/IrrE family metallo-endopeptidase [Lentzea flava]|uniref:ImmA/IrrE family metallo-endopeptidase n=1 Tax=Lentzea flava TaxID=103732 RepID=UPI0034D3D550
MSVAGEDVARVDAFCTSRLPRPIVILTPDRANDIYRHRFTAAHELGHLLLHTDVVPGDPEQEREASRFAAELLTRAAEIERELPSRFRISALEDLSRVWGVPCVTSATVQGTWRNLRGLRATGVSTHTATTDCWTTAP